MELLLNKIPKKFTNFVLIRTANSLGGGILFQCDLGNDSKKVLEDYVGSDKTYLVLTNAHVIYEYYKDISSIKICFYDKKGERIYLDEEDILDILYADGPIDIAALLVRINKKIEIEINTFIKMLDWKSDGIPVLTKGFPGILQLNREMVPITVSGTNQISYRLREGVFSYKINNTFHYYAEYVDEDFYGGLSGSPVLMVEGETEKLIGMNESILADSQGANPFGLINYRSIKSILDFLREAKCLLHEIIKNSIRLIWVKEIKAGDTILKLNIKMKENINLQSKTENLNLRTVPSLLVMGSSGAGKSSFINSLCKNTTRIHYNGDGQSTRMDVIYYLHLYDCEPWIKVEFMEKSTYIERRYKETIDDIIVALFRYVFEIRIGNIKIDPIRYLAVQVEYLQQMALIVVDKLQERNAKINLEEKEFNPDNEITQIKTIIQHYTNEEDGNLNYSIAYLRFFQCLVYFHKWINCKNIKQIFDPETRDNNLLLIKEGKYHENTDNVTKLKNEIKNTSIKGKNIILQSSEIKLYLELLKIDQLQGTCQESLWERNSDFEQDVFNIIEKQEGFFDFKEYSYLFEKRIGARELQNFPLWLENCLKEETVIGASQEFGDWILGSLQVNFDEEKEKYFEGVVFLIDIWDSVYKSVSKCIGIDKDGNIKSQEFDLCNLNQEQLEILNRCMMFDKEKSLTSFVNLIKINDYISDIYARIFEERGFTDIAMIDTCGLDHVGNQKRMRQQLIDKNMRYKYLNENVSYTLCGILYVKKMDSGHPTEIQDILSFAIEDTNLEFYCVFNGTDIYEITNGFMPVNKDWYLENDDDAYPKAFRFLRDKMNKDNILIGCNAGKKKKERVWNILQKNMIMYCCNYDPVASMDDRIRENNIKGIQILLDAVNRKELNSSKLYESDEDKYIKYIDNKKDKIEQLVKLWFAYATKDFWFDFYFKTLEANINRTVSTTNLDPNSIGHAGCYNLKWESFFTEAYTKVLNLYAERIIGEDDDGLSELTEILLQQIPVNDPVFFSLDRKSERKNTFNEIMRLMCNRYEDIINKEEKTETKKYYFISPYRLTRAEDKKLDKTKAAYGSQMIAETNFEDMINTCIEERMKLVDFLIDRLKQGYKKQREEYIYMINNNHPQWKETFALIVKEMGAYNYDINAIKTFLDDCFEEFVENKDNN